MHATSLRSCHKATPVPLLPTILAPASSPTPIRRDPPYILPPLPSLHIPSGARDLEESIGVSLSARRFEVNRLELTLSIGSFSAAIGAMVAGIFGMNMKSMLEHSVTSFWGVSLAILFGCIAIFLAILTYTRKRRIL